MGQEDVTKTTTGQAQGDDRADLLVRQVQNKVALEGKHTDNSVAVSLGKLFTAATGTEKCRIYFGWLFACITGAALPCFFFFLGPVFDSFGPETDPEETRRKVRELCIIMGILAIGVCLTSFLQNYLLMSTSASVGGRLKTKYLEKVLNQESAWYDQSNYLELASRMTREVDTIQNGIGQKFGQILHAIFMSLAGFAVGFTKGWSLSLVLFCIAPILFLGMGCFASVMQKNQIASMQAYGQSAGYAEQALSAIRIVVSFGQEKLEIKNYSHFLERVRQAGMKQGIATGMSTGFFYFCIYASYCFSFSMGAIWVDNGFWNHTENRAYSAGDTIACFFGVLIGLFALGGAGPAINAVSMAKAAGKTAYDVIDRVPTIIQDDQKAEKHKIQGEIEFRNVQFIYPSRPDQKIMDTFNCTFKMGETTALVGPSGSGKSTVVQLVERFYDPSEGSVLIDGKDLKSLNLSNYRQQIGYVGQEPVLFNTTIKQNILMGKPDATDEEIVDALKKTNAWEFVSKGQDGINAQVGAGGGQLSGGQKQRLALARAFIKKPRMLIFDEATSALDKTNEAEVQRAIDHMKVELGGSITTLVIAHRLSTIEKADRILVLKKGSIVQDGTHSELAQQEGSIYQKMVNEHQKSQAKEEANQSAQNAEVSQEMVAQIAQPDGQAKEGALKMEEITDKDPEAINKLAAAEKIRLAELEKQNADMDDILNIKTQDKAFQKEIGNYAKPSWKIGVGCLMVVIVGCTATLFGWFIMEVMTILNIAPLLGQSALDESAKWIGIMGLVSAILFIAKGSSGIFLAQVAENITMGVRTDLYNSIIRKDIGWHDQRDNSAGVMTATLASDVQLLNGVSSEGLAVMVEAMSALATAFIGGGIFSWPMMLVGLAVVPLIVICGTIAAKADNEAMMNVKEQESSDDKTDDQKASQILASDSIANYKTVASFGNDQILIHEFSAINLRKAASDNKSAVWYSLALGLSVGIQNGVFAIFYFASGELSAAYPDYKYCAYDRMYISMFLIIFGSFTAATSFSMGPDINKAKRAAVKIFKVMRIPSKVDVLAEDIGTKKSLNAETFQGKIEFKDVWFRYPARLNQWIFKGLNLTIEAKEAVAVVGESGQGKSTFISLVMRFYDPEFGQVLIDGVDVREYNIVQLRERFGLVMQEPQLFNYSLKENILYGKLTATNSEILESAQAANCREFIESEDLSSAFDDDAASLKKHLCEDNFKEVAVRKMGQQGYEEAIKVLDVLIQKQKDSGTFEAMPDLIDTRTESQKGREALHKGYDIMAGNRGSKLSGGQKQRIAIARAIIRRPGILLLDEATSALDETSQRLVQDALKSIMQGRTSIVVAHRLTTVQECSRLAVIDGGKIVETDTFENLVNGGGHFAKLAKGMRKAQAKEDKDRLTK